jgi:hypothetical protein
MNQAAITILYKLIFSFQIAKVKCVCVFSGGNKKKYLSNNLIFSHIEKQNTCLI